MDEKLDALLGGIRALSDKTVDTIDIDCTGDAPEQIIGLRDNRKVLNFGPAVLPDEWYIKIPVALSDIGINQIHLVSHGWWIGDGENPGRVSVTDHIACHVPSPLTGSPEAMRGEAFIDMKGAYLNFQNNSVKSAVLWHTNAFDGISDEEKKIAKAAGCTVASATVAPWVIGARASGLLVSAWIILK